MEERKSFTIRASGDAGEAVATIPLVCPHCDSNLIEVGLDVHQYVYCIQRMVLNGSIEPGKTYDEREAAKDYEEREWSGSFIPAAYACHHCGTVLAKLPEIAYMQAPVKEG